MLRSEIIFSRLIFLKHLSNRSVKQFPQDTFFAVRSSALEEDGTQHSFAGQFESRLYVPKKSLAEAIKAVWASAYSDRVRAYKKAHGLDLQSHMAIIIQQMIDADVSGVAFGIHPVSGNRRTQLISSLYGLGEGLVSGQLEADHFEIHQGKIESIIAEKKWAMQFDFRQNQGIHAVDINESQGKLPSLIEEQIYQLSDVLNQLQQHFGKPQDVEFAFAHGQLYLLQARPITHLNTLTDPDGQRMVWDNSNIVESYPGLTLPLTFSFIIRMYAGVYEQLCELLGVRKKDIHKHKQLFSRMLGLIKGRVYYNLHSWYKILSLLPGYSLNAAFMEKMMGVKEKFTLKDYEPKNKFSSYWGIFRMVRKMLSRIFQLPLDTYLFQEHLNKVMKKYEQIDFDSLRAEEIIPYYRKFEEELLSKWNAPLVNDFFAMIFFGLFEKLTQKWIGGEYPGLHNDLLSGSGNIISTEPIHLLLDIATHISCKAEARHAFSTEDADKLWQQLEQGRFPDISPAIDDYLRRFGDRCIGELKLSSVPYSENPVALISIIQAYVKQGVTRGNTLPSAGDDLRDQALLKARKALKRQPLRKFFFFFFLRQTRQLVSNRENLRFERTRAFGMVRKMYTAIGKNFYFEGVLKHHRDIFYLTQEEIFGFIEGTAIDADLSSLVERRKKQYQAYESVQPAERITTYGLVHHGNDLLKTWHPPITEGEIQGIGCCPGIVRGRVRIVNEPGELKDLKGDILVTTTTDPGWVPLFPTASAILVERGSLLSHAAIVSREMGKPCIVGINGLTHQLKNGDWIEMDGSSGIIKRISPQDWQNMPKSPEIFEEKPKIRV